MSVFFKHLLRDFRRAPIYPLLLLLTLSFAVAVTVTASGSECYLVGYGVGTAAAPYQAVSGSVTLAPGQAVICIS